MINDKAGRLKMNTPNKISVCRIFIVPIFLVVYFLEIPLVYFISAAIFGIACITDAIDGHLARKNNQITVLGKLLDPIADKLIVAAALFAFLKDGLCNIWIVMIIISREFIVSLIRLVSSSQGVVVPANTWGKIKTAYQMIAFIIVMIIAGIGDLIALPFKITVVSNILLGIAALLAVVSGTIYVYESKKVIDYTK